jgi:methylmalonyl-CoA mutase C-terminal domain/subunit
MPLMARIMELLAEKEMADVPVFLGGIIPNDDIPTLKQMGVAGVFGPGASMADIVTLVRQRIRPDRLGGRTAGEQSGNGGTSPGE